MSGAKGRSGPRKKPLRELQIIGSRHVKGRSDPDPLPPENMPMPSDLTETEKGYWKFYTEMLTNCRILSSSDYSMLVQLVKADAEFQEVDLEIKTRPGGPYYIDDKGVWRAIPHLRQRNELRREIRALAAQFGMSPSSRGGVSKIGEGKKGIKQIT